MRGLGLQVAAMVGLAICSVAGGFAQQDAAAAGGAGSSAGSAGGGAAVTYRFERPGLAVPRFRMTVGEDGTAVYEAEEVSAAGGGTRGPSEAGGTTHVEQKVSITPATAAKIFKTARAEKMFHVQCASKAKNIADTGGKTLSYEGPDGKGACTYNYTENKAIAMLTDLFLGMAATLDEGRKLEFKRRYDRLGLDAELDVLTQASDAGRAVELGTISPLLRQLANDTEMMQRVRLRAAKLLDRAADGR